MLVLKKTAAVVLALSASTLFAGTMGCTPGNVTVPCETRAWDIGIQALYLKPNYTSGIEYTLGRTQDVYNDVYLDSGWGFRLEGSYHFSTGNDITVNWIRYKKSTDFYNIPMDRFPNVTNDFHWEPKFNAVNVEFGQHVDLGDVKNMRFHGGVQYANIKTVFTRDRLNNNQLITGNYELKFSGFGPRAGLDMSYGLNSNFSVNANAAAALLVGTSEFQTDTGGNQGVVTSGSSTRVVPELEAKIGASYTWTFTSGDLLLDGGWMWMNYFHSQQLYSNLVSGCSNFALNGPYVGLTYIGNV